MKNFDRGNKRNFGGGGFEKRDFGGSRGFSERKEMFPAVCSDCGNNCEVPFRPSGSKPVFCSDCFRGHDAPAPRGGGRDRDRDRDFAPAPRQFQDRPAQTNFAPAMKDNLEERLTAVHNKLDKITDILNSLQRSHGANSTEKPVAVRKEEVKDAKEVKEVKEDKVKKVKAEKKTVVKKEVEKKKPVKKAAPKAKAKVSAKK